MTENGKKLLDAIGRVDDELIVEAEQKRPTPVRTSVWQWFGSPRGAIALAACTVIVFATVWHLNSLFSPKKSDFKEAAAESSEAAESAAEEAPAMAEEKAEEAPKTEEAPTEDAMEEAALEEEAVIEEAPAEAEMAEEEADEADAEEEAPAAEEEQYVEYDNQTEEAAAADSVRFYNEADDVTMHTDNPETVFELKLDPSRTIYVEGADQQPEAWLVDADGTETALQVNENNIIYIPLKISLESAKVRVSVLKNGETIEYLIRVRKGE